MAEPGIGTESSLTEKAIQTSIMLFLLASPKVKLAWVTSTGRFRGLKSNRPITIGVPGMPDIMGILEGGRCFGIEVKSPGGTLRPEQADFICMMKNSGAAASVCYSLEDAEAFIKAIG